MKQNSETDTETLGSADAVDAESIEQPDRAIPENALIILPVRNTVLFPGEVSPLMIGRPQSIAAAQEATASELPLGVVMQRDPSVDVPGADDLYEVGTVAGLLRYVTAPDGAHHVVCGGKSRFKIKKFLPGWPFLVAEVDIINEPETLTDDIEAQVLVLRQRAKEIIEFMSGVPNEVANAIENVVSSSAVADFVASLIDIPAEEKQALLETVDVGERLKKVSEAVSHRLEVLRISQKIGEQTKESISERQREHILREQLRTIQRELGEDDEGAREVAEILQAIEDADLPEEALAEAKRELKRLERMPEAGSEHAMIRTYLDWMVDLPWSKMDEGEIDITEAKRVLDEDHYGLEKIKRRIVEYLAVMKLSTEGHAPILCFVGPPGVGKTSLGQSIARAMGRKFTRVSLGGVHDEAEIRGHRRTYIGAMPGNIIQGLRKAGVRNPVFMLDEMDKLGTGFHGDPSAALLEVLDPAQNTAFRDNYLGVPFDLSAIMFIGTANVFDNIPGPLRDRMEIIEIPSYTEEEKLQIARRYLVPRQRTANGLKENQFDITDAALSMIIASYTREAGVRNLERRIGAVCRSVAVMIAEGSAGHAKIDAENIETILGAPKFEKEIAMRTGTPGVATGLAWTPVGGDILFIEAARIPGKGRLIRTGQLGDVMKESAEAAFTLVKARAEGLGIDPKLFEKSDIHVHVPAGAIPKDGPSAGVTMVTALVSLLTGRCVKSDVAMTGEVSLRGLVMPIGGVKEKVLVAARAGVATVLLPARNKKDLEDVPAAALKQVEVIFLESIEDAIEVALEPTGESLKAAQHA